MMMKKGALLSTILVLTTIAAGAQDVFDFSDSSVLSRMKKDVFMLASDSFQGRNSGTEGEKMAYEYLIPRFREAGLQPMGTDGSWLQPFPEKARREAPGTRVVISGNELKKYDDYGTTRFSPAAATSGEIIDVGSGLFLPEQGVDDYAGKEVAGKIVLMDLYVCGKWVRNDSTGSLVEPRSRIRTAFSKGAAGVICHNPDSRWGLTLHQAENPDTMPGPVIYVTRDVVNEIREQKQPFAELDIRFATETKTFNNIVGYLDNHAPSTVILGAHYDHTGVGMKTGLVKNGADDNASGTAMIAELARYYAAGPYKECNFLFIAFSGEEEGLKGSHYYAAHPTIDLKTVDFMFNFDMVGRLGFHGNRIDAICTGTSKSWRHILKTASTGEFRVRKIPGAGEFSDHYPFYIRNIPIAYLTTGMHYDYHTSRDDAGKINYEGMVKVLKYARGIIEESGKEGGVPFKKVSRWSNIRSMLYYINEQLDYLLTAGFRELN